MEFGEAIRAIKERLSLVDLAGRYLNLRRNGSRYVAPCPFHQETRPSFYIFEDRNSFYCFGCQASGDIIEFYSRINGLDFRDTVFQLAEEAGISIDSMTGGRGDGKQERTEKQAMLAMHEDAAAHFIACLNGQSGAECRAYIAERGINPEIRERFGLGWAEREWHSLRQFLARRGHNVAQACAAGLLGRSDAGNVYDRFRGRLMFPIKNLANQTVAFGGRIIVEEDEAKYINSSDTPIYSKKQHLYGLAQARRGISAKGFALLTEGYMDVLTLHQFGFDNSVGALGTALTEEQIRRLSGFTSRVMLVFDGDAPGRKAALRAAGLFLCRGLSCSVVLLPDGEDIDSLLRGSGSTAFEELMRNAPEGISFCLDTIRGYAPREALEWAKEFIAKMNVPELASRYISLFAHRLGLSEDVFRSGIPSSSARQAPGAPYKDLCERDSQILAFLVRYPERLEDLREMGADMALATTRGRALWRLIEKHGPEEAVYHLDERQKKFWLSQRGPQAPPRKDSGLEMDCLKSWLEQFFARSQAASLQTALSGGTSDFAADLDFLQAIRDTMRKNDEQS